MNKLLPLAITLGTFGITFSALMWLNGGPEPGYERLWAACAIAAAALATGAVGTVIALCYAAYRVGKRSKGS